MINYNPKDWIIFIFKFPKTDTFRKLLPLMFVIAGYSYLIAYVEIEVLKLSENSRVNNITMIHSLLGFVLSLLLVFRTNTAYDRWWEGRKLWGSLVNNSRNLALKLAAVLKEEEDKTFFREIIPSYAAALRDHLRREYTRIELFDIETNNKKRKLEIDESKHVPNQVAGHMFDKIYSLHTEGVISGELLIFLNGELQSFTDICGACERIRNTPIPYSYSMFLKKFIFFYVLTLPMGYVFDLSYYIIPVVVFIFYVLASLELLAEEIEEPFGKDSNDLPINRLCITIKKNIEEIL